MIFLVIAIAFSIYYVLFISKISTGWGQYKKVHYKSQNKQIGISILVPFRNEEDNLERNWNSIQGHLKSPLDELIYINDHSNDKSIKMLEEFTANQKNVSILYLKEGETGKKTALEKGIKKAKNSWVLTTDADCIYHKNWLLGMKDFVINNKFRMGIGPVSLSHTDHFFTKFQALEFTGLMTMGAAFLKLGKANTCSGANLIYHKQSFMDVNGFEGNKEIASGDDEFLMHKFYLKDSTSVGFVYDSNCIVKAAATKELRTFFQQRIRWASKGNAYQVKGIRESQIMVALYIVFFWLCTALGFNGNLFIQFAAALLFGTKLVFDYLAIQKSVYFFKNESLLPYLPIGVSLQFIYIPIVGIVSFFKKGNWKGR